jgi:acetoin utilization deacetylase AcuC-like enzyme
MTVGLVFDERYLAHAAPGHVERPERLLAVRDALRAAGLWDRLVSIPACPAADADLLRVHSADHVDRVRRSAGAGGLVWFDADTYACPATAEAAWLAAGGVCAAADAVMAGTVQAAFCAARPPGHHALPGRAMGFCLFNNVAVAVRHVQAAHGVRRVLILDWDLHHGNGTQDVFYRDADVLYVSAHQWPHYPGTGSAGETGEGPGLGQTLNYPLDGGAGDAEFLDCIDDALRLAGDFAPQFVFISAGFDSHRDDPLGGLKFTEEAFAEATRRVRRLARETAAGRIVSVLEGGYNLDALGRCAVAHVRALLGDTEDA